MLVAIKRLQVRIRECVAPLIKAVFSHLDSIPNRLAAVLPKDPGAQDTFWQVWSGKARQQPSHVAAWVHTCPVQPLGLQLAEMLQHERSLFCEDESWARPEQVS